MLVNSRRHGDVEIKSGLAQQLDVQEEQWFVPPRKLPSWKFHVLATDQVRHEVAFPPM